MVAIIPEPPGSTSGDRGGADAALPTATAGQAYDSETVAAYGGADCDFRGSSRPSKSGWVERVLRRDRARCKGAPLT